MTARGFYTLLFGALMLFTALSVGSAGAFLLGTAALLCWALSLLCVCAAALSCRAEQQLEGGQTQRGGTCRLILRIRFCFFQLFCTCCYIIFRSCYIIFQLFDLGRKSIHLPVKLIDI